MKLLPYLYFNGNCAQAIAFYEKVFGTKAEVMTYKDAKRFDPNFKAEKGRENWVIHACMKIADGVEIQLADCDENGKNIGTNICLQLSVTTADEVKATYSTLKEGGKNIHDPQPTFYSPMFSELIDKFGIHWCVMQEMPAK